MHIFSSASSAQTLTLNVRIVHIPSAMKLVDYLKQQNLSISEFARRAQILPSTASRAVHGKVLPSERTMRRIIDATGGAVQPNDFFEDAA